MLCTRRHLVIGFLVLTSATYQPLPVSENPVRIREATYAGRPHFIVHTASAVYYYDRAGGGLSRIVDAEGRDWIGFRSEPWDEYPASAGSSYRGIPNLVFGSSDSGAGHPGYERCTSEREGETSIRSTSLSGKWQWTWTFFEDHARLDIERMDHEYPYWFLYEGTPGGVFEPARQYFGTDTGGPRYEHPDYLKGAALYESWRWVYFGHTETNRVLFIAQEKPDALPDAFAYMGNTDAGIASSDGMTVFGFGRAEGARPLLENLNTFYLGLWPERVMSESAHERLGRYIERIAG